MKDIGVRVVDFIRWLIVLATMLARRCLVSEPASWARSGGTQGDFDWYGYALIGRVKVTDRMAVVGRVERFSDPDQVLILTGLDDGFRVNGFSVGGRERTGGQRQYQLQR